MLKQTTQSTNNVILQRLTRLTNEFKAINLSHNYTEFACPHALIASLNKHIYSHSKYAPKEGSVELRHSISELLTKRYFRTFDPESEITITAGATQAIFCAIASSVGEGDEVIVFEPLYKTYIDAIRLAGARATFLQLKDDLTVDWNEVQKAITSNTKLIIVNSPHYPTGAVLSPDDWEILQKLIIGTKIKVLSDESLNEVTYTNSTPSSISFFPRLASNSFMISSLSKTLCVAGWKIGYCIAPTELTKNFRKIQSTISNSVNYPMQMAFADYLGNLNHEKLFPYLDILEENHNLMKQELASTKLNLLPVHGGYYQVIDCSEYTTAQDVEFAEMLIKEHGISVMPMSFFYHDKHDRTQIRINIAVAPDTLRQALYRLKKAIL